MGDVLTVLPFGNTIATFELTGAEVIEALENGVSRAENAENEGTGRFAQVAGLRYSWDPSRPVGERIISAEVRNTDGSFSPIDPNATYQAATNDFNRKGGDDYAVFVNARNPYDYGPSLDQAVQEYIATFSPVSPQLEGRIAQVEGAAPATTTTEAAQAPAAPTPAAETPATLPTAGQDFNLLPAILTSLGGVLASAGVWLYRKK